MQMRLDELINQSEGSQLISYTFEERGVRFQLFHEGFAVLLSVVARTDTVYGRSVPTDSKRARCRIVLTDLESRLFIKDGRYIPSIETEVAVAESRAHLNLAYGRRASETRWMFTLRGEYDLLCFLLRDLADLQWVAD